MKIHLRLLDKQPSYGYNQPIPIYLGDIFTCIGECEISRDKDTGECIGILKLNQDIPMEYFLYYRSSATENSSFFLTDIQFTDRQLRGQPSSTLRDCLIEE